MHNALAVIARGSANRWQLHKHFWSVYGNLDMRSVYALLDRELIRERERADVAPSPKTGPMIELYLTESGRYVLAYPDRLPTSVDPERPEDDQPAPRPSSTSGAPATR